MSIINYYGDSRLKLCLLGFFLLPTDFFKISFSKDSLTEECHQSDRIKIRSEVFDFGPSCLQRLSAGSKICH